MEPAVGQIIAGKFRLERRIGRGAMGSIWGARHLSLNAPVALKFMSPALVHDPLALARFGREAEAAARIRSPHVVQVLDHGVDRGAPFIVMEWLDGEDLGARLRRVRRLSLEQTAVLVNQAARALGAAHQAGVIHRDLKPSNVFLARMHDEETVKLLDFGVAKLESPTAGPTEATATGAMVGTPDYMSPEQVKGSKHLDHRADLWSLGVILYVALTGRKPFAGDSLGEVILRICTAPLTPPSALAPDLPPTVDLFFARACAREPADRFQSAAELSAAFLAVVQGAGAYAAAPASARHPFAAGGFDVPPPSSRGDVSVPSSVPSLSSALGGAREPSVRDLSGSGPIVYVSPQPSGGSSAITSVLLALIIVLLVFALAREHMRQAFDLLKGLL